MWKKSMENMDMGIILFFLIVFSVAKNVEEKYGKYGYWDNTIFSLHFLWQRMWKKSIENVRFGVSLHRWRIN
jgi:hypothetical protein